jgi:hypothetical protein
MNFTSTDLSLIGRQATVLDSKKGQFPTFAYAYIKGYLLMELSKATKEAEKSIHPKEELWENAVDRYSENLLESEIILSYCHNLTPHQKNGFYFQL